MSNDVIICRTCCKSYDEVYFLDTNQALFCAAEVSECGILGAYGSTVLDMCHATWIENKKPDFINFGTICDDCIIKLKQLNLIEINYLYWG